jgi:hypothetical protein
MNADPEEYPKMAASPSEDAQDQEQNQEEGDQEDDEVEQAEEEEEEVEQEEDDDLEDEDDNADYDDNDTDDEDSDEGGRGGEEGIDGDFSKELVDAETHSEVDQQSFSDQLSSSAGSTSERAVQESATALQIQSISRTDERAIIHRKRPYDGSHHSGQPEHPTPCILEDPNSAVHNRKRIRSELDMDAPTGRPTN